MSKIGKINISIPEKVKVILSGSFIDREASPSFKLRTSRKTLYSYLIFDSNLASFADPSDIENRSINNRYFILTNLF